MAGGSKIQGPRTSSLSSPLPSPELPSSLRSPPSASPSLPLEVAPLKSSWGSAVSSPSVVWGGAPAEIEFGAF